VLRPAVYLPPAAGPPHAALGRDDDLIAGSRARSEGLRDEALIVPNLAVVKAVHIGRVDESDPCVNGSVDYQYRLLFRRTILNR
jgi:hypothetical protein